MTNQNVPNEEAVVELLTLTCEIDMDGSKIYLNKEGKLHRMHGPAATYPDGSQYWYKDGNLHREDGPAVISNGDQHWYKDGERHREDGPAIEFANGANSWYKNGIWCSGWWAGIENTLKRNKEN